MPPPLLHHMSAPLHCVQPWAHPQLVLPYAGVGAGGESQRREREPCSQSDEGSNRQAETQELQLNPLWAAGWIALP